MCFGLVRADETGLVVCISISISTCTCPCAFTSGRLCLLNLLNRALPIRHHRFPHTGLLISPFLTCLLPHFINAFQIPMHSVQIRREARKRRRGRERLAFPRASVARREEAADASERTKRLLCNVRRCGLERARGRREGEGGRALQVRGAAPFRGARRDHDAWLEERDVPPWAAWSWRRHDGL